MGEEARSIHRGLAGHLPERLDDIERRMPGERRLRAASIIARNASPWPKCLEFIAVIFHHVEGFVANRPRKSDPRPLSERCLNLSIHTLPSDKRSHHPVLPVREQLRLFLCHLLEEEAGPRLVPLEPWGCAAGRCPAGSGPIDCGSLASA